MKSISQFIALLIIVAMVDVAQGQTGKPVKPKKEGIVREKFFFSFGVGTALVNTNAEVYSPYSQQKFRSTTFDGSFATTFRMGGTPTPYWVVYYENKVCFTRTYTLENEMTSKRESLFSYSLTGIGITRFLNPTMPSYYFNATVGLAKRIDAETYSEYAEKGTGFGMALGSGYQFSNRWALEANLIYGNVSGSPRYDSPWESQFICLQISINYLYFKSYKLDKLKRQKN